MECFVKSKAFLDPHYQTTTIRERPRAAPVAPPGGHVTGRVNLTLYLTSDKLFVHSVTEYYTRVLYICRVW